MFLPWLGLGHLHSIMVFPYLLQRNFRLFIGFLPVIARCLNPGWLLRRGWPMTQAHCLTVENFGVTFGKTVLADVDFSVAPLSVTVLLRQQVGQIDHAARAGGAKRRQRPLPTNWPRTYLCQPITPSTAVLCAANHPLDGQHHAGGAGRAGARPTGTVAYRYALMDGRLRHAHGLS